MITVVQSLSEWQAIRSGLDPSLRIGFVPTMGNLHAGHASLLARAKAENDISVLSIFVNQTQFNDKNDYENYPKTQEADITLAKQHGVDYVLLPQASAMYPDNYLYRISEHNISTLLEGKHRPGHFDGVLTVVMKLLLLVRPNRAYFGEKDYQQYQLIQGMVDAFFMQIEIIPCPTVRQHNGLALSSRNTRLSPLELEKAALFAQALHTSQDEADIATALSRLGFEVDYIEKWQGRLFGAVKLGEVRLIDNHPLLEDNLVG